MLSELILISIILVHRILTYYKKKGVATLRLICSVCKDALKMMLQSFKTTYVLISSPSMSHEMWNHHAIFFEWKVIKIRQKVEDIIEMTIQ